MVFMGKVSAGQRGSAEEADSNRDSDSYRMTGPLMWVCPDPDAALVIIIQRCPRRSCDESKRNVHSSSALDTAFNASVIAAQASFKKKQHNQSKGHATQKCVLTSTSDTIVSISAVVNFFSFLPFGAVSYKFKFSVLCTALFMTNGCPYIENNSREYWYSWLWT